MSLFVGPVAGALIAGGVYYGFSNLIQTRTEQHRRDLRILSVRLTESPVLVQAPPSAATRISERPFSSYMQSKWNEELAYLFAGFHQFDERALEWGRKLVYGRTNDTSGPSSTPEQSS